MYNKLTNARWRHHQSQTTRLAKRQSCPGLPEGRAARAASSLPAGCPERGRSWTVQWGSSLSLACPSKATRTVVFLRARYHSPQSIHQGKGNIRNANVSGTGRTNGHAGNPKGELSGNGVLRTGREVSGRGQALGRWS